VTAKGLRALVCGAEIRDSVKEREHIHKIVADSPWIFGEQFALGRSETSLTNLLREHLKLLKRDTRVTEPVLKAGGKSGRVDIMLAKLVKISGRNDDNHLVIELKRANRKLTHKDFSQLLDYATSIIQDSRFDKIAQCHIGSIHALAVDGERRDGDFHLPKIGFGQRHGAPTMVFVEVSEVALCSTATISMLPASACFSRSCGANLLWCFPITMDA
jgi:hypothetical protein